MHGDETSSNSAVNAVAFNLGYFRKPVKMEMIAQSLDAGVTWSHDVALTKIRRVLEESGLHVSVSKDATFIKVAAWLSKYPRIGLAIIDLKGLHHSGGQRRHYVSLLSSGYKGLFIADPGMYTEPVSIQRLNALLARDLGHICLFIQPGDAPQSMATYSLTTSHEIMLNCGEIARGPGSLEIPFLLRNTLKHPISINFAKGTCFCFKGAAIATKGKSIAPGKAAKIILSFDRGEIGIGNIEREALLSFDGYPHHWLQVLVKCHITANHPPIQLPWYPQAICVGVVRSRGALCGEEFTVLTPKGVSIRAPVASSKAIRVIRLVDSGGMPELDAFGRTAHEFVVDLSGLPVGMVNEKITIGTTDKYVPKIVIPITGQIETITPLIRKATP